MVHLNQGRVQSVYCDGYDSYFQALTKYLKSVSWNVPQEAKQALDLLAKWSPMDVEDALELLSPNPAFAHRDVRRYAVTRLQQADDEVRGLSHH